MPSYQEFLQAKLDLGSNMGIAAKAMPPAMFPFQQSLTEWALWKGRAAIFADCGLGKTLMQLEWARQILEHTNKPVLILTPLAVGPQTVSEGDKFGYDISQFRGHKISGLVVANYERIHYFSPGDFGGVVCDESSILKSFDGVRRQLITEFMRVVPYRLLCTATAAPNDYTELGTSSEALGELGYMDMLGRFFTNNQNSSALSKGLYGRDKWRFKQHAQTPFWRWVSWWARAIRKPSDLGFDDDGFILPDLKVKESIIRARQPRQGMLFDVEAIGLAEEREVRRRTITERCEKAAALAGQHDTSVVWCHLNDESALLAKLLPQAVEVSGSDSDEAKEEKFRAFQTGAASHLITKPKIGGFGLNWQHCAHVCYFPSHSYEQYYQAVRRCWRFGQQRPVEVDIVGTDGDRKVFDSLSAKADAADQMFTELVQYMREAENVILDRTYNTKVEVPSWV